MGHSPLGAKWQRRIARITGLDIVHASGNGTYTHWFTTVDHRHGIIHAASLEWELLDHCPGFTSCVRLFPTRHSPAQT